MAAHYSLPRVRLHEKERKSRNPTIYLLILRDHYIKLGGRNRLSSWLGFPEKNC